MSLSSLGGKWKRRSFAQDRVHRMLSKMNPYQV